MKKYKLIISIILINLISQHALSQSMHNVLLWGSGGYSSLLTDVPELSSKGGPGFGIGGGYELHYKHFIMQTGVEFTYLRPCNELQNFVHDINLLDSERDEYVGHYHFSKNKEIYKLGNINIPFMAGGSFGKTYFLLGAKAGFNIFGNTEVSSTVVTNGTFLQLIDDLGNMTTRHLGTRTEKEEYPLRLDLNVSLSAEIGFYLNAEQANTRYRLALFCDYGLVNVRDNSINDNLIINKAQDPSYHPVLNSFMQSNIMRDSFVNPLYAGLKFTVKFGLKGKSDCMCDSYSLTEFSKSKGIRNK